MAGDKEERAWRRGRREGRVSAMSNALLKILAARGIHVSDSSRRVIERCNNTETLGFWLDQALVATRIKDVLRRPGREEGLAEGLARALLKILAFKGWQVDDASRHTIERCRDVLTLERWLDRALVATRLEEVLDPPDPAKQAQRGTLTIAPLRSAGPPYSRAR